MTDTSTEMPLGERIRYHRERRGLTQLAVAAQVRRSENWLSKVERGIIPVDSYRMILNLAGVLGIRNLADLTGQQMALAAADAPQHASVTAIRGAMSQLPVTRGDSLALPILTAEQLAARVADAWHIYNRDKARYDRIGPILPELIGQAHRTARTDGAGSATRSLIGVYHLAQIFLRRLGERELAHLAADRALTLAGETGDLVLTGASAWNLGMTMLSLGDGDLALDLATQMIGMMNPLPDEAGHEYASVYGGLHLLAAIACARSVSPATSGRGWDYLREAERIAARIDGEHNDFSMSFGKTNVAMHAVHLASEEGDPTEALRLADQVDVDAAAGVLPLERTTRYLIEVMQAHRLRSDDAGTMYMLDKIERLSPEEIKHFPVAREAVRDLITRGRPLYRGDAQALAMRLGVIA